jgi:uncharacterized membrane protein
MLEIVEILKQWIIYLSVLIETGAGIIIALAFAEAIITALGVFLNRSTLHLHLRLTIEDTRLHFGKWLTLALEFELAADILRTAVAPTWDEIGKLAAIIVLRTVLNFFLQQEIERADKRRKDIAGQPH